jgi:predicted ArsR family transcriptional regulator
MGSSADQILRLIKTRGPSRASEVATQLGQTPQGVRQQLDRLLRDGLVEARDERQGVGRPRRIWSLTPLGEARFPDGHGSLSLELVQAIREEFGEATLERLIARRELDLLRVYDAALADRRRLGERVGRLAEVRTAEGYMAEASETAGGFLLLENHCPVRAAASACRGLCHSELDSFRRVLGPDCQVQRTEHILAGARRCAYRITPLAPPL